MNIINSNLQFKSLSYGNNPDTIVLHHAEASVCSIYDIHKWHLNNGWAGCGYNYYVRKDGSIYTGRPENAIGAHCPGMNSHSIGICAEGEYMNETMPQTQKQAIIELCQYIKNKYGIQRIVGHGEVYSTNCPGTNYPLSEIRNAVMYGNFQPSQSYKPQTFQSNGNSNILDIQRKLNKLKIRDYEGKALVEDGKPGERTTSAIKNFQGLMGLTPDGVVGNMTNSAFTQIFSMPLDGAQYQHYEYATRYIQWRVGSTIDGNFGNATALDVLHWQAVHVPNSRPDGIVGSQTWSALLD